MLDRESVQQTAKTVALMLVNRDVDINELAKVATYLRTHLDGTQFFRLLETMVKDGRYLVRSGRTLDYYRGIRDVCQQHLNAYRNAKGAKAKEMSEIVGWAVRLMRYYKEVGVPPEDISPRHLPVSTPPPTPSAPTGSPQRDAKKKVEPKQAVAITSRELVTVIEDAKHGRTQVQTKDGEHIVCTGFPPYPAARQGMRCRADIIRQDGKAQRATFKKWE